MLVVGDEAPGFCLLGTKGQTYCLSDYRGSPVILAFYPEDHSAVCTLQMRAYSAAAISFDSLSAVVLGLSPQGVESHDDFTKRQKITFPLLCDISMDVARAYGVLGPLGFYRRSIFVIDQDGLIAYLHRSRAGLTFRPTAELLTVVQSLTISR